MLIKEYRIPLPMTVEEYRIAQLYMIAKKSREESKVRSWIFKMKNVVIFQRNDDWSNNDGFVIL